MTEIADELEAARAACGMYAESEARLLAEAASWRRVAERLETEKIQLREALQRIADQDISFSSPFGSYLPPQVVDGPCRKIALAALSPRSGS